MRFPVIEKPAVFHVGRLDEEDKKRQGKPSLEAFCISVSEHPDDWRRIAQLGDAPAWLMERPCAKWLDVLGLTDAQRDEVVTWGRREGLVRDAPIWRAWFTDEEGESYYLPCANEAVAHYEVDVDDFDDGTGPGPDGCYVDRVDGLLLSQAGLERLERWRDPLDGFEGLVILYAHQVIDDPDLVGLWWNEDHEPSRLSCPRGALFPERLDEFRRSCRGLEIDMDGP